MSNTSRSFNRKDWQYIIAVIISFLFGNSNIPSQVASDVTGNQTWQLQRCQGGN